ncbi:MAG: GNAT family N-acetyltransferase [Flavobacteriaceae bacterium]|nr:GNAT family N-acetyltransferase [Flavobacteriaceae bacterium]|tara:strand:- start:354 stop:644 length:291 start_codon:yes stop_codon:yes gene_type:complete
MDLRILDNPEKKRFEAPIEGKIAFIEYIRAKDAIYLTHTEVPESLGGRGIGSALVKEVLQQIEGEGLLLAPLCPFVAGYLKKHPEWQRLLAKGYHV